MEKIIYLKDFKKNKQFEDRYKARKYLIKAMLMYKDKYSLYELKQDFDGLFNAMELIIK